MVFLHVYETSAQRIPDVSKDKRDIYIYILGNILGHSDHVTGSRDYMNSEEKDMAFISR